MSAMEADTAPVTAEEQQQAAEEKAAESEVEQKEEAPEFKSSRNEEIDWASLTDHQKAEVTRYIREGKPPEGFVPHGAMHQERVKRQEMERKLAELEAQIKPAEEAVPEWKDPIEDPAGHRAWTEYQAKKAREDAIAEFQKSAQTTQEQQARLQRAAAAEQQYMQVPARLHGRHNPPPGRSNAALADAGICTG